MNRAKYNTATKNVITMCKERKKRYPQVPKLLFYAIIIGTLPLVIIADMLGDSMAFLVNFPIWLNEKVFNKK